LNIERLEEDKIELDSRGGKEKKDPAALNVQINAY
jgi:hypothetical protein